MHDHQCKCDKRIPSGRMYLGNGTCIRCGLAYVVTTRARKRQESCQRQNLGRLSFTPTIVEDISALRVDVHRATGLRHPSHYKGMGGSSSYPCDDPIRFLSRGYAEGDERIQLADRLIGLIPHLPVRSCEAVHSLVSFLRG